MHSTHVLRAEGLAAFAAATAGYYVLGGPLWLYLVLALAPDLSMLGYLRGPRVGAAVYNAAHTYVAPGLLAAAGVALGAETAVLVALVWAAHVGADRTLGYGLKDPSGFTTTHLGSIGSVALAAGEAGGAADGDPDPAR
jgi:hypothetical protein